MAAPLRKIINDPVFGFITIDNALIFNIISHPCYQRLRRINQMAFAHLVYPGAVHAFTNPYATEIGKKYQIPIAYNEKADKDSWQRMKTFLKNVFGK